MVNLLFWVLVATPVLQENGRIESPQFVHTAFRIGIADYEMRCMQRSEVRLLDGRERLQNQWFQQELELSDAQVERINELLSFTSKQQSRIRRLRIGGQLTYEDLRETRRKLDSKLESILLPHQHERYPQLNYQLDFRCQGFKYFLNVILKETGLELTEIESAKIQKKMDNWYSENLEEVHQWCKSELSRTLKLHLNSDQIDRLKADAVLPPQCVGGPDALLGQLQMIEKIPFEVKPVIDRYRMSPWFMIGQTGMWIPRTTFIDKHSAQISILKMVVKEGANERFELFLSAEEIVEIERFIRQYKSRRISETEAYSDRDRNDKANSAKALQTLKKSQDKRRNDLEEAYDVYLFSERSLELRDLYLKKINLARHGISGELLYGYLAKDLDVTEEQKNELKKSFLKLSMLLENKIRSVEKQGMNFLAESMSEDTREKYLSLVGEPIDHPRPALSHFSKAFE